MKSNRDYFRQDYPDFWLQSMPSRASNHHHVRYQEISLDHLECFDGCSVLECGCGAGELLDRLSVRYPNIRLFGVDLGRESLRWARANLPAGRQFRLVEADIMRLPISTNSMDRVLCSSVLFYLRNPVPAVHELIRVLKPGGRFVFDFRPPWHVTNFSVNLLIRIQRAFGVQKPVYSFLSPSRVDKILGPLPVTYRSRGFFTFLPTRLPILGERWGNWVQFSDRLSFNAGMSWGKVLSQKLLVTGTKCTEGPYTDEF